MMSSADLTAFVYTTVALEASIDALACVCSSFTPRRVEGDSQPHQPAILPLNHQRSPTAALGKIVSLTSTTTMAPLMEEEGGASGQK